jgi:hypothetical protein
MPYKVNFNKFVSVNKENTDQIEKNDVYLYNEPPYPIPANDMIVTTIYWNNKYDINTAKYDIYDIYGERMKNTGIKFEPTNNYSGKLIWECSNIPTGVYLLQIKLGEEQKSIPIIINR